MIGKPARRPRWRLVATVLFALLPALFPALVARGATQTSTFTPVADASVDAAQPTTTYGGSATLEVDGSPQKQAFLRFDVGSVDPATVTGVRLRLRVTNASPEGGSVRRISDSTWNESITWNARPAIDGPVLATIADVSAGTWIEVPLGTEAITSAGPVSFAITSSHRNGADYASRESGSQPSLILTTDDGTPPPSPSPSSTPSPTTVLAFGASADATVDADRPSTRLGTAAALEVDGRPEKQALMRFVVSGVTGPVRSVRLRMYATNGSPEGGTVRSMSNVSWSESSVTWNTRPVIDGGIAGSFGGVSAGSWYEADLGTAIGSDGTYSFALTSAHSNGADYASRETAQAPALLVEVASAPSPSPSPSSSPSPDPSPSQSPSPSPSPSASPSPSGSPTPPPVAETLTFVPVADASVNESSPTTNLGSGPEIEVDADPRQRSFIRFNVAGIGAGRVVTDVRLRLYNTNPSSQGGRVFWIRNTTWNENTITWQNQPPIDGELLRTFWGVTRNTWQERSLGIALTADGVLSLAMDSDSSDGADYATRETGTPPTLLVDVAPAPPPPPPPSGDPVIAAAGDIACPSTSPFFNGGAGTPTDCRQMATSDLLVNGGYAAVLALGDLQYENGTAAEFSGGYDPSWGRVKSITYPVPGNHEYNSPNAGPYFDYFGARAGDPSKGYYSFDVGQWHIVVLNSHCPAVSCSAGSAQEKWLRADLAANPAGCTLAVMHHPRFSSAQPGGYSQVGAFWQALDDYDADVVLAGHHHNYERFAPLLPSGTLDATNGIRSFIVGTGGESFEDPGTMHPASRAFNLTTYGVLELRLKPTGYDWNYVPIPGQTFRDSGSGTCH